MFFPVAGRAATPRTGRARHRLQVRRARRKFRLRSDDDRALRPDDERAPGAADRDRAQELPEPLIVDHRGEQALRGHPGKGDRLPRTIRRGGDVDPQGRGRRPRPVPASPSRGSAGFDGSARPGVRLVQRPRGGSLPSSPARKRRRVRSGRLWIAIASPACGTRRSQDTRSAARLVATRTSSVAMVTLGRSRRSRRPATHARCRPRRPTTRGGRHR